MEWIHLLFLLSSLEREKKTSREKISFPSSSSTMVSPLIKCWLEENKEFISFDENEEAEEEEEKESLISFSRLGVLLHIYTLSPANPRAEWRGIIIFPVLSTF